MNIIKLFLGIIIGLVASITFYKISGVAEGAALLGALFGFIILNGLAGYLILSSLKSLKITEIKQNTFRGRTIRRILRVAIGLNLLIVVFSVLYFNYLRIESLHDLTKSIHSYFSDEKYSIGFKNCSEPYKTLGSNLNAYRLDSIGQIKALPGFMGFDSLALVMGSKENIRYYLKPNFRIWVTYPYFINESNISPSGVMGPVFVENRTPENCIFSISIVPILIGLQIPLDSIGVYTRVKVTDKESQLITDAISIINKHNFISDDEFFRFRKTFGMSCDIENDKLKELESYFYNKYFMPQISVCPDRKINEIRDLGWSWTRYYYLQEDYEKVQLSKSMKMKYFTNHISNYVLIYNETFSVFRICFNSLSFFRDIGIVLALLILFNVFILTIFLSFKRNYFRNLHVYEKPWLLGEEYTLYFNSPFNSEKIVEKTINGEKQEYGKFSFSRQGNTFTLKFSENKDEYKIVQVDSKTLSVVEFKTGNKLIFTSG